MLTRKQLELLEYINGRLQIDGVSPSFEEMKKGLGLSSKSGVHRLILALEERGFIRRLANRARALEVLKMPQTLEAGGGAAPMSAGGRGRKARKDVPKAEAANWDVPVMGRIAAGVPIEAIQHRTGSISVPPSLISRGANHYALDVKGDSMTGAGINDGDIVVIREQSTAESGDIIVALIDDEEATLKILRRRGGMVELEAANPDHENRMLSPKRVKVQGRMVGLIRSY